MNVIGRITSKNYNSESETVLKTSEKKFTTFDLSKTAESRPLPPHSRG